jgi:hypothetical protein
MVFGKLFASFCYLLSKSVFARVHPWLISLSALAWRPKHLGLHLCPERRGYRPFVPRLAETPHFCAGRLAEKCLSEIKS